jgi:sulfofructose kinase
LPVTPKRNGDRSAFPALGDEAKAIDVVGLGENSVDLLAVAARFPKPDTKQPLLRFEAQVGGQIATALVACARLGWRTRYLGGVGDDDNGRRVRQQLAQEGVDAQLKTRPRVATRTAIILVEQKTGRRTVLEIRDPAVALGADEVDRDAIAAARVLLVDACDPALSLAAATTAREAGIPVVLDVEHDAPGLDRLLRSVDVIVGAASFAPAYTGIRGAGKALERLAAETRAQVVMSTLGPDGSLARVGGREFRTPGFRVDALDTTGAGDAFRGGLIAGWLAGGRDADPRAILGYANAVAALNCLGFGAQTALPRRAEVEALVTRVGRRQSK